MAPGYGLSSRRLSCVQDSQDFLTSHQAPFTAIDVSFREHMEELRAKRGGMVAPVLVVGAEQAIG